MLQLRRVPGFLAAIAISALLAAQEGKVETKAPQPPVPQQQPKPGSMPGNSWFAVTELDLGTFFGEGEATGVLRWKNPSDKAVEWKNLSGSCQCLHATIRVGDRTYELRPKQSTPLVRVKNGANGQKETEPVTAVAIEAHEEGEVEVHLDMQNFTGPKMATLDIHTTDPGQPQVRLKWNATGATLFSIAPQEINLNKMTWSETREFTASVTSPMYKDWNITRMDDAGKAFDVKFEKVMNGDTATWSIKGKYGPVGADTAGGGVLKFYTDIRNEMSFTIRVMAFVQGPLEVKPGGFLTLGMIPKGKALKKEIVFEPNDGTKLEMTGFHFEKTSVTAEILAVTAAKDGDKLVVSIEVSDKAPVGLLKGDLVIELNHPLMKEKRIMFNGFVR